MGKNTYFSLPEQHRPLKNRLNIVLTSNLHLYEDYNHDSVLFTNDSTIYQVILNNRNKYCEMYNFLQADFKIFFIGGKTIYEQFISLCDTIWVTQIKCNYNCDLFLDYDYSECKVSLYQEDDELKILEYTRH
jgi:dihydrofolate reductase